MSEHNHTQTVSSSSWTITHGLNSSTVAVDVMIDDGGNLEKIIPANIVHTDDNNLTVTFSSAQTGRARVVGKD